MFYRIIYQLKDAPEGESEIRGMNPEDVLSFFDANPDAIRKAVLESKQESEKSEFRRVGEIKCIMQSEFCVGPEATIEVPKKMYHFSLNVLRGLLERNVNWNSVVSFSLKTEDAAIQ